MTWEEQITATLCQLKLAGHTFTEAWAEAIELHPPRGRYAGPTRPSLLDDESLADFLMRACQDAWEGRRPMLAHLPSLMEHIGVDGSSYARPSKRSTSMRKKTPA